jgi:hypothetical protein
MNVHHAPEELQKGQGGVPQDLSGNPLADRGAAPARRETWVYDGDRAPRSSGRRHLVRFHRSPGTGVPELAQPEKVLELLAAEVEAQAQPPR